MSSYFLELILYAGSNILQYELQVVDNDPGHLGRLLQLILGVAINCDTKTDHIQALLTMEQDVQRVVMMAIQELTGEGGEPSPSLPTIEDDAALAQLMKVTTTFFTTNYMICIALQCFSNNLHFFLFKHDLRTWRVRSAKRSDLPKSATTLRCSSTS